eukprot:COSAG02_NODE_541_length_20598_cov_278.953754_9_plen_165_part_00
MTVLEFCTLILNSWNLLEILSLRPLYDDTTIRRYRSFFGEILKIDHFLVNTRNWSNCMYDSQYVLRLTAQSTPSASPVAPVLQRIRSKDRNPPTLRVLEKCVHKMIFSSPREARRWPLALAPGAGPWRCGKSGGASVHGRLRGSEIASDRSDGAPAVRPRCVAS